MATDARHPLPGSRRAWLRFALAFVALALLFRLVPQLDLAVAGLFHDALGFSPGRTGVNGVFYWIGDRGAKFLFVALTLATLGALLRLGWLGAWRRRLAFLWLALFIGPGVVVNLVLKEHVDRPRPAQVVEFGGQQAFRPAFDWTNTRAEGHSFVSGHASFAFFLMALAWVDARRAPRWFAAAAAFGALMGWSRMDSGSHFLSDVVFAWFAVYACCALSWWLATRLLPPDPAPDGG